ncbi:MAG: hypothetical protein ABF420_08955 [Acetobacter syzygii]|uniref:hypothetical protein n=1 Tax=Acetobacter syzygii TaxID=146476 RepID=UPI0039ED4519
MTEIHTRFAREGRIYADSLRIMREKIKYPADLFWFLCMALVGGVEFLSKFFVYGW